MAGILVASDRNILGRKSAVVSQRKPYSDLDVSLSRDVTNDIAPLKDIDAVKAAVKNLVLTSFGERPFQPNLGSAIKSLLFEPADRISIAILRKSIVDVLRKNEPRIDSITIEVKDESENNRYVIDLGFRVISLNQEVDISFYLQRVR
jgi:phage baseplate assembly protein W